MILYNYLFEGGKRNFFEKFFIKIWRNKFRLLHYYGYSVEEYMDYTDKFYSMEFVASEVRRKRIQIKDERLAHLFDIINENYRTNERRHSLAERCGNVF